MDQPFPPAPGGRPIFLTPEAENAPYIEADHDTVPDLTTYDAMESLPPDGSILKPRHREVARLHALGKTNNQICEKLGYTPSWISTLLSSQPVMAEVDRYRNRLYEQDVITAMKDLGSDSVRVIEEIIRNPAEKSSLRADQARWVLEKLTGKAKQEVNVESNTLVAFMDTLRQMQSSGESLDVIDVSPSPKGEGQEPREIAVKEISQRQASGPGDPKFLNWIDTDL